jgi:VanZ family protein
MARAACVVYVLLLVYSGLAPWAGWRDLGVAPFAYLSAPVPRHVTAFDLLVNVLAYVPLGALVVFAAHPRLGRWLGLVLALASGIVLSGAIEAVQTYLPNRVPSNIDLATNSAGALLGGLLATPFAASLIDRGRLAELRMQWFERRLSLLLLLVALWPITQLYPAPMLFGTGDMREPLGKAVSALGGTWPTLERWDFGVAEFVLAEAFVVAAATLASGLAFASAMRPAAPRSALILALITTALLAKTLAHGLYFGPERAFAWLTPGAFGGLSIGTLTVLAASAGPAPWLPAFALLALAAALAGANVIPHNPYYLANMQDWRPGALTNFSALTHWLAMLWPVALALALLARTLSARALR